MKAWVLRNAFGLDNLKAMDPPSEVLGTGQIRLKVKAVSLNYRDLMMIRGQYNPRQPLPLVPGSDACCEVVEVGTGVSRVKVGDRVIPIFAQSWLSGRPGHADRRSTLGGPLHGTFRPHMVVSEEAVVHAPEHLTDEDCATLPCAGVTAWRALFTEGGIGPGSRVLTLGTGGVSLFALELAKMAGAQVAITSSSDDKLTRARQMGADFTLNYIENPRWGRMVQEWAGEGVDLVVELGGAGTLEQSLSAVRPGGTVALIGVLDGVKTELALTRIFMSAIRVQGILVGNRDDLQALCDALTANPHVRPVIQHVFGWNDLPRAFETMAEGGHMGKLVVRMDDNGA